MLLNNEKLIKMTWKVVKNEGWMVWCEEGRWLIDHPQRYHNASALVNMKDGSDRSKNMKVKVQIWDPQMGAF
jgi:hypothetical protein